MGGPLFLSRRLPPCSATCKSAVHHLGQEQKCGAVFPVNRHPPDGRWIIVAHHLTPTPHHACHCTQPADTVRHLVRQEGRRSLKLTLHHINLVSDNVERMGRFYRDVLGLSPNVSGLPTLDKTKGYAGDVEFVTDGAIQTHLAQKDMAAGFNSGQIVNPVSHGHIAYRTDDIVAFMAHLDTCGIPYSDWGNRAVAGWHQIFFYDPEGNVIEVHQQTD